MDPGGGSSLISLRSISDGEAEGESERKRVRRPSSGKKSKKPASPYGTLRSSPKKPAPRRSGREVWVQAVQQGGGVSAESKGANTWRYGKPQHLANATSATPFLKTQLINGPGSPLPNRQSRPGSAGGARVGGSGPVYKDAESYYDDIQVLKRQLKEAKTENELVKANNGRLQDEVVAKSRKIEELLNPDLQSNDLRRTLTSKKPDTSEVVMSLRRKVYKAEENLRDKENVIRKMKSDMKRTDAEELILENQVCMYEMERLRRLVEDSRMHATRADISDTTMADSKGKPQLLLKRLQDDNYSLVLENKSLKNDLMKLHSANQTELDTTKDYEDMNRNELLQKISSLEQRLKIEEKKAFKDDGNVSTASAPPDAETIDERCIELKGPLPQQIKQLRDRERELVGQVDNLEETVRKLKEDRTHYRKLNDDYRQQVETLTKKIDEPSVAGTPVGKKEDEGGSDTASIKSDKSVRQRKSSLKRSGNSENTSSKAKEQERKVSESKVIELREKNAAKKIQKGWRQNQDAKKEKKKAEEEELEDAIIQIQSSWRGHRTRQSYLNSAREEEYSSQPPMEEEVEKEEEEDLILIQSALRGHQSRKQLMQRSNERATNQANNQVNNQVNNPAQVNPPKAEVVVDESDDDDDVVIGSSASLTRFRQQQQEQRPQQQQQQQQHPMSQSPSQSPSQPPFRSGGRNANRDKKAGSGFEHVIDEDSEGSLRSLRSLKSSSTPWSSNVTRKDEEEESEDGEFSNNNNRDKSRKKKSNKASSDELETSDITKKWADSGEKKEMRSFQKRLSLRRSQQLMDDFRIKDGIGSDEDVAVPSFQRKMTALAASRKTDVLDDELF